MGTRCKASALPRWLGSLRLPHSPQPRRRNRLQTINQGVGPFYVVKATRVPLRLGGSVPRLPRATPVAARIRVSHLRGNSGVVHRAGARDVRELWAPDVGDRRHALPGYAHVVGDLVPSCLVGRQPEERRQRAGTATSPRPGQLSNRMDVAAQASTCDGPAWQGPFVRGGRGGRNLRRPRRARPEEGAPPQQVGVSWCQYSGSDIECGCDMSKPEGQWATCEGL